MGKYEWADKITIGEKYSSVLGSITTPEEAQEYLEACIEHTMRFGRTRDEAEEIERSNIGYVAGYFSNQENARVQRLFNVVHPIFGSAAQFEQMTLDEIIQKGIDVANKE